MVEALGCTECDPATGAGHCQEYLRLLLLIRPEIHNRNRSSHTVQDRTAEKKLINGGPYPRVYGRAIIVKGNSAAEREKPLGVLDVFLHEGTVVIAVNENEVVIARF